MLPMNSMIGVCVSSGGKIGIIERSQMNDLAVTDDLRSPRITDAIVSAHAFVSGCVVPESPAIGLVLSFAHIAQIAEAIVERGSIGVVNLSGRPCAMNVKPNYAMGEVSFRIDRDHTVAIAADIAGVTANGSPATADFPNQCPCLRVIVEKRPDMFNSEHDSKAREEEQKQNDRDAYRRHTDEQKAEDQAAYVQQRLREAAIWERRLNGK